MRYITLFNLLLFFLFLSCRTASKSDSKILTERIQYDVLIKSPDPEYDWWVQNLEGPKREYLIKNLIDAAYSGNIDVYDYYFNTLLTSNEVKNIGFKRDTLTFQRPDPPYELYDTVVEQKLDIREITKIRFLEEWYMDEKTLEIEKMVIGLAPLARNYDEKGEFRGYMPLFWIYFDERYPLE